MDIFECILKDTYEGKNLKIGNYMRGIFYISYTKKYTIFMIIL